MKETFVDVERRYYVINNKEVADGVFRGRIVNGEWNVEYNTNTMTIQCVAHPWKDRRFFEFSDLHDPITEDGTDYNSVIENTIKYVRDK